MFSEEYVLAVLKHHHVDIENEEMKNLAYALIELFQATDSPKEEK